jgi:hypothetical protein
MSEFTDEIRMHIARKSYERKARNLFYAALFCIGFWAVITSILLN